MTSLAFVGIAVACLLAADYGPVEVSHTERVDFPPGGVLKMVKCTGDLTIEGWDQNDVELTTIKSTASYEPRDRAEAAKSLEQIKIAAERKGDELAITTELPKHPLWLRPIRGVSDFELRYVVRAPRNARVIVEQDAGNVYIDDMAGDVRVTDGHGQITFHLPEQGRYAIDAKCGVGAITSDFAGPERGKLFHRTLVTDAAAGAQKVYARMGVGDILIMKINAPRYH